MLSFDERIPDLEKHRLVTRSIFRAAKKSLINKKSLISGISAIEKNYLESPKNLYRVITEISISQNLDFPNFREGSSYITFCPSLNSNTRESRENLINNASKYFYELPSNYSQVSIAVNARSAVEAVKQGMDDLDYIRGLFNLAINSTTQTLRFTLGGRHPVNKVVLGPIHTIHTENGDAAIESWWYDPKYYGPIMLYSQSNKVEILLEYARVFRKNCKKLEYHDFVKEALIRYTRALDSRDYSNAYLQLWGILEFLTDTVRGGMSEKTIDRAACFGNDRDYARQLLINLREHRNRSAHAGYESDSIEDLLFILKNIVESVIEFLVFSKFAFTSIKEFGQFLDLSSLDIQELSRQIKLREYAKKTS